MMEYLPTSTTKNVFLLCFLLFLNFGIIGSDNASNETITPISHIENHTAPSNVSRAVKCRLQPTRIQLVFFTCLVIFIPVTIVGNGLVCVVIGATPSLSKQPMYMFLLSLAIADLFVGVTTMPVKAKMQLDGGCFHLPHFMCGVFIVLESIFSLASTMNLFAIAIDRYCALKYTYRYNIMSSRSSCVVALLSLWTLSALLGVAGIVTWDKHHKFSISAKRDVCIIMNRNYYTVIYTLGFLAPVFLMAFIYSFIYHTALRHLNEISRLEVHVEAQEISIAKEQEHKKKQVKLLTSLIIVYMAYVICWVPCVIFILTAIYERKKMLTHVRKEWFQAIYFILVDFLPHFSSLLNPFIYVFSNATFRSAMYKVVMRSRPGEFDALTGNTKRSYFGGSSNTLQTFKVSQNNIPLPDGCSMSGVANEMADVMDKKQS